MKFLQKNRIIKLEKEIILLENMNVKRLIRHFIFGIICVPVFIIIILNFIVELHMNASWRNGLIALAICLALWIWWLARYSDVAFFVLVFPAAIMIVTVVIASWFSDSGGGDVPFESLPNRKSGRQFKLDRAIAKRKEELTHLQQRLRDDIGSA